jgi:hypothetical protein
METALVIGVMLLAVAGLVGLRNMTQRKRRRARAEYERLLKQALDDGVLSPDELAELETVRQEGALTPEEVRMAALAVAASVAAVVAGGGALALRDGTDRPAPSPATTPSEPGLRVPDGK